jgi:two-component system LytT family response regulator
MSRLRPAPQGLEAEIGDAPRDVVPHLNALEQQLDPTMFFRAGRKEIVNLKWIQKVDISVAGGLAITLRGGRTVEMSRRQSSKLREILSL